jgi:hypothetical protein
VPAPRDFSAPRASSVPTRAASSLSSRSATSRHPSYAAVVGVSFRAPATEVREHALTRVWSGALKWEFSTISKKSFLRIISFVSKYTSKLCVGFFLSTSHI